MGRNHLVHAGGTEGDHRPQYRPERSRIVMAGLIAKLLGAIRYRRRWRDLAAAAEAAANKATIQAMAPHGRPPAAARLRPIG
jgi:hypothetical protein